MKVAVVGAGPAGLMSASTAAENGCKVTLFERNEKVGKKLYITGKGRCNLTNICTPKEFLENVVSNPKFLYGSICSFTPNDTMQMFEEHGVKLKVERGNRVFPLSDKASDITKALVQKCEIAGVEIQRNNVIEITHNNNKFCLHFENGVNQIFDSVILACGGMSYPTTGSNGDGYKLATKLGHTLTKPVPALVPIILHNDITILQGLTLKNVNVKLFVFYF